MAKVTILINPCLGVKKRILEEAYFLLSFIPIGKPIKAKVWAYLLVSKLVIVCVYYVMHFSIAQLHSAGYLYF